MRVLILSDIHGNATALATALQASEGRWDAAVCLGDLVGYGPDPNEVIEQLRGLAQVTIRGNHDKAACGITELEDFNPVAKAALVWTRNQLTAENLEYLRQLPGGPADFQGLVLVHGSPRDEDEYIFGSMQALNSLLASTAPVTFFGHTHMQGGFSYRGETLQAIQMPPRAGASFAKLRLEQGTRYLLNPGSIGQPRDGDSRAGFAIADLAEGVVEFWRVPYDIKAVQDRMILAAAPDALVSRLTWGR